MTTVLEKLGQIKEEIGQAELSQDDALAIIKRIRDDIEQLEADLSPHTDPRWLLFPLDITWPVSGEFLMMYTIGGITWQHEGIDLACPVGCGVRACASGVVTFAGVKAGYGKFVTVEHQHNAGAWKTGYAHLSVIDCIVGQAMIAHQCLGLSGATGNVSGAHLHLTVWSPDSMFKPVGCTEYLRGVVNPRDWVMWP
jgi:murein DD-endopeptidase MepM/ murein hydrolase activator NlpD